MIYRISNTVLINHLKVKKKVVLLLGARQTGKTTLLKEVKKHFQKVLILNADEYDVRERFEKPNLIKLKEIVKDNEVLIVDEAQRIDDIGISLKILYDDNKDLKIIATGSSAFDLKNKTSESLTGRKIECFLYPLSFEEMTNHTSLFEEKRKVSKRLIYGYYPDVVTNEGNEIEILKLLADSYLYKDILMLDTMKKPEKLFVLLQAIAHQIGNEVSYSELSRVVGLDSKTIETYIELLEKSFIVFRLRSLVRNARNELKKSKKIYFYDNGIRNAVISNFTSVETRQDVGALWENFIIAERYKYREYHGKYGSQYFWRTKYQSEIDYIEEYDGMFHTFEFKWNEHKKPRLSKTFSNAYPQHTFSVIAPENIEEFVI